ncbi:hypothetical protein FCV60_08885 [Vibrio sp. F13]|uniref:hypothetical protein n=1 Tax=Vibrio sp. F13 TaxID=2070777 RepID=UPI0010BDEB08|nr:hypothetical protein [Vibrio sp. F13]TKF54667.1 hypothetical protein FCV60_08885 [Vibrio sp. F13]
MINKIRMNSLNRSMKLATLVFPVLLSVGCNTTDEAESAPQVMETVSLEFSDMARHSLDLVITSDNSEEYFWDDQRIQRTSSGEKFIEYIVPGHVRTIDLTTYYDYGISNKDDFLVEVSKNGIDYKKVNYFLHNHGESPNWWLSKMVGSIVVRGDGYDHVKITFPELDYLVDGETKPATPQIGEIVLGYDVDESLAQDNVLGSTQSIAGGNGVLPVPNDISNQTYNNFQHYISRGDGSQTRSTGAGNSAMLYEGSEPYRFVSFNMPELFIKESPWQRISQFEIEDALKSISAMGGKVTRTYVPSIQNANSEGPYHISFNGNGTLEFNETLFKDFDLMLDLANKHGVRLVIPLIDYWHWWGGIEQLANNRGLSKSDFYTSSEIKSDYKKIVSYLLNRVNTVSGVAYKDDPAILGWETGNELMDVPDAWTAEMAAYIKSIDSKHLVIDGQYGTISTASAMDPNIDMLTNHYYWANEANTDNYAERFERDWNNFGGLKPFFVGEVGLASASKLTDVVESVVDKGATGIMLWSLRQQSVDGGYLDHSEGNDYRAYHWPGFAENDSYDEQTIINMVWNNAYAIDGANKPDLPAPDGDAKMLPIDNVGDIRWQGVTSAQYYNIERFDNENSVWQEVGSGIVTGGTDSRNYIDKDGYPYQLLFADYDVTVGETYSYRVQACNSTACTSFSDSESVYVDYIPDYPDYEFSDNYGSFNYVNSYDSANLAIDTGNESDFFNDVSRVKRYDGSVDSTLDYIFDSAMTSLEVIAYFDAETTAYDFSIKVSSNTDGSGSVSLSPSKTISNETSANNYKQVIYSIDLDKAQDYRYLSLSFPIIGDGKDWAPQLGQLNITRVGGGDETPDVPGDVQVLSDSFDDDSLITDGDAWNYKFLDTEVNGGGAWVYDGDDFLLVRNQGDHKSKVYYDVGTTFNTLKLVTYYHQDSEYDVDTTAFTFYAWTSFYDDGQALVPTVTVEDIDSSWYKKVTYSLENIANSPNYLEFYFPELPTTDPIWDNASLQGAGQLTLTFEE